jgi:hypothetical protein
VLSSAPEFRRQFDHIENRRHDEGR